MKLFILAIKIGMRSEEIFGPKWEDVGFENKEIDV